MKVYELVQDVDGYIIASIFGADNFLAAMEVRGFDFVRANHKAPGTTGSRAELQGEPVFSGGVVGPCWGGLNLKGEMVIRYETVAAHNILSA